MTTRFRIDRILGDRPFAEIGDPTLAVRDGDRACRMVAGACGAVAGMQEFGCIAPVGVYGTDDLVRLLLRRGTAPAGPGVGHHHVARRA